MFSDLFEKLRDGYRSTLRPALQNLFSAKRNFINIFAVILILETLLGVLLLSLASNMEIERTIAEECEVYSQQAKNTRDDALLKAAEMLSGNMEKMRQKNTSVFVFAMLMWFSVSAFIFTKMFSSSVDLNKFVYGLYITFGADTKKIRRLIFWQMLTLGILALALALPLATVICKAVYGFVSGEFAVSVQGVFIVLGIVTVLLLIVITSIARHTASKTCISLLSAADVSDYVRSPRRSSKKLSAEKPFGFAAAAVRRMRGYYTTLVISAVLPACLVFCCMSLAKSGNTRYGGELREFTFTFANGFESSDYAYSYRDELAKIPGVAGTSVNGGGTAAELGSNMLFADSVLSGGAGTVAAFGGTACDNVWIISCDTYSLNAVNLTVDTGRSGSPFYGIELTPKGSFRMVYPVTMPEDHHVDYTKQFYPDTDEMVFFSYADESLKSSSLEDRISGERAGMSLRGGEITEVTNIYIDGKNDPYGGWRIDREYMVLNPADFSRLTGIDVEANVYEKKATPAVRASDIGSYIVADESCYVGSLKTAEAKPVSAVNDFFITVGDDFSVAEYGLPSDVTLPDEKGEVTLILRRGSRIPAELESIMISGAVTPELDPNTSYGMSDYDLLRAAVLEAPQSYTKLKVTQAVVSDTAERDTVLLYDEDYASLFGRASAYTEIYVNIAADTKVSALADLMIGLFRWGTSNFPEKAPVLTESGALWDTLLTESCRYNDIVRVLALMLLLSVPFIWFYPQFNHYRKRRSDLTVLVALGQPRSRIRDVMLSEGVILAVMSAAAALVLCPLFTAVMFAFMSFIGLPFAYGSLDLVALLAVLGFSALCAVGSAFLNYLLLFCGKNHK